MVQKNNLPRVSSQELHVPTSLSLEETEKFIKNRSSVDCNPDFLLYELSKVIPQYQANPKDTEIVEKYNNKMRHALFSYGLDNHYPLVESVRKEYRPLLIRLARDLTKEFNCTLSSEKSLVQIVVIAYGRVLEYTVKLNNCVNIECLSHEKNNYYGMISKELDRANRHFLAALTTLQQIKNPPLKVNIKTNTAFIAQNQQNNSI